MVCHKAKLCATGCGRFLKKSSDTSLFCTQCGTVYHYMMKYQKYKGLSRLELYKQILKINSERNNHIRENFTCSKREILVTK